jgi:hypothetical protein
MMNTWTAGELDRIGSAGEPHMTFSATEISS